MRERKRERDVRQEVIPEERGQILPLIESACKLCGKIDHARITSERASRRKKVAARLLASIKIAIVSYLDDSLREREKKKAFA